MKLSVGIITHNEEKRLGKTLAAVKELADEIIIVDSGSTDGTEEISKKYNVKFYSETWKGYGLQKNSVIDKCSGEWILLIDADEVISEKLAKKIKSIINSKKTEFKVYMVNFLSVCFGKKIRYGGWSGLYRVRLFENGSGRYNSNEVHEEFVTREKIFKLKEEVYHYSYINLQDYLEKFNRYTTEGAKEYFKRGKKSGLIKIFLNPVYKFMKMYFFRLGFLDGIEGLLLAVLSAAYNMVKYYKLREMKKNGEYLK